MSANSIDQDYFLASDEELGRLQVQAQVWQPDAESMLDRIGVGSGWACADMGCGGAGILGPMSRRAGDSGSVLGFDSDPGLLDSAAAYRETEDLSNVLLQLGDVTQPDLPHGAFDLVHSRFLLPHVDSPVDVLGNKVALAKPGGVVASQENDHSSWNFYPHCPEWDELLDLLEQTFALRGDINIGRRTFHMFRECGLEDVRIRTSVQALQDQHPYMRMPLIGAKAMRERMLEAKLTTAQELDRLINGVEQAVDDPDRVQFTFTLVQVWGRKSPTWN
ncbi:methyltransferase family protein [Halospina denitrificans]|uniref:Methyltransferase family protein n=1 Tax=Halospina denitrificans TaxID=332522 RepID=A0A4R7JX87_9GAMM|nr:methyltransferase domain-containing protein [Halospina denitrificans]TDT41679.1 methyltransferase family protein [Halospina denitrificans]